MGIQKNFVVKNGIEVNDNLIFADKDQNTVGIGTTITPEKLQVSGGIGATSIVVTGVGTIPTLNGTTLNYATGNIVTGVITSLSGSTLNYSGIATAGSYRVGNTEVISSARELKNIASLDSVTTATIESAIANAPNTFTDLEVTGISTLGILQVSSGIVTATSGIVTYYGDGQFLAGVATVGGGVSFAGVLSGDLYVTGIGTINNVTINSGIITAVSGIVTYYGDGQYLNLAANPDMGIGIATEGGTVGTGATILDFRGPGISTVTVSAGIATINITGGGGGGGAVSIGTEAPTTPTNGDLWYSPDYARTFVWYDEVALGIGSTAIWVDAAPFNINLSQLDDLQVNSLVVVNHTDLNTLDVSGISTLGNVVVGSGLTDLIVNGDARVTGILTIGTSSLTLNGNTNEINGVTISAGVVTATGFVGDVTGTATGLTGSPNVTVGVITATSAQVGSAVTVDASGISITGVITATSYSGDGSGLTGVGIGASSNVNTTGIGTFGTIVATNDLDIPSGTTAERPVVPTAGSFRYNSDLNILEFYDGANWRLVYLSVPMVPDPVGTGVFGGGETPSLTNTIDYITIATTGNATDFGDLTVARDGLAACSSSTRGVFGGGYTPSLTNTIDYITIATTGNTTDFGDLTVSRDRLAACSSSTRGVFGGGTPAGNVLDYITIATTGDATDFGDLTVARNSLAACSSSTRGVFGGGSPGPSNVLDYITIATTGDATDFGDLTVARYALAACSSSTRGVFGGGTPGPSNVLDYITIATTGNATDFGDLTVAKRYLAACSSSTRGVFGGGFPTTNTLDYITIATTGNATDFGDLTEERLQLAACSSAHGGLS